MQMNIRARMIGFPNDHCNRVGVISNGERERVLSVVDALSSTITCTPAVTRVASTSDVVDGSCACPAATITTSAMDDATLLCYHTPRLGVGAERFEQ